MRLLGLVAFLLVLSPLTTARALAEESEPARDDRAAVARSLFSQGRVAYDLGNYDEAITKFRGAYEQIQEPAFLFNIAQAYRLKNDCSRAIDSYRHFLRLAREPDNREAAETHLSELQQSCRKDDVSPKGKPLPTAAIATSPGKVGLPLILPSHQQPITPPKSRRKIIYGTLATGGALAAVAIGLGVWNLGRYDDWSTENDLLANPPPGTPPSDLVSRQEFNDDRLSSIGRVERIGWGLAAGAVIAVATAIVLEVTSRK